jgi:hypothetical protein
VIWFPPELDRKFGLGPVGAVVDEGALDAIVVVVEGEVVGVVVDDEGDVVGVVVGSVVVVGEDGVVVVVTGGTAANTVVLTAPDEAPDKPWSLVAVTLKEYEAPARRPVTVNDVSLPALNVASFSPD